MARLLGAAGAGAHAVGIGAAVSDGPCVSGNDVLKHKLLPAGAPVVKRDDPVSTILAVVMRYRIAG